MALLKFQADDKIIPNLAYKNGKQLQPLQVALFWNCFYTETLECLVKDVSVMAQTLIDGLVPKAD